MADTTIGPYVMGEKPPPLVYQFLDAVGAPINLTGYSAVLRVQRADASAYSEFAATVSDPTLGKVTRTWSGTEFPTPGPHWLEFWAGNTVNRFASVRLRAEVRTPVGPVPAV